MSKIELYNGDCLEFMDKLIAEDIKVGEVITEKNVRSVRPGFGLHPRYLKEILSKRINKDLVKGERLSLDDIQSH